MFYRIVLGGGKDSDCSWFLGRQDFKKSNTYHIAKTISNINSEIDNTQTLIKQYEDAVNEIYDKYEENENDLKSLEDLKTMIEGEISELQRELKDDEEGTPKGKRPKVK